MATDIVDKDLKGLRNARWDKAFKDVEEDEDTDVNRKATIVVSVAHDKCHFFIIYIWTLTFQFLFFRLSIWSKLLM